MKPIDKTFHPHHTTPASHHHQTIYADKNSVCASPSPNSQVNVKGTIITDVLWFNFNLKISVDELDKAKEANTVTQLLSVEATHCSIVDFFPIVIAMLGIFSDSIDSNQFKMILIDLILCPKLTIGYY